MSRTDLSERQWRQLEPHLLGTPARCATRLRVDYMTRQAGAAARWIRLAPNKISDLPRLSGCVVDSTDVRNKLAKSLSGCFVV